MLASILPGIFPVVLAGTVLWAMGEGLQFASVVALTVSFGLGLQRHHPLPQPAAAGGQAGSTIPAIGVERATILVGPALILTSVVLACGLAVMVFSDLPSLRLFGWLSAFAMLAALTADLLILRPTAMFLNQMARRFSSARSQPAADRLRRAAAYERVTGRAPARSRLRRFRCPATGSTRSERLPLVAIDSVAVKPTALGGGLDVAAGQPCRTVSRQTPRVVSFQEPEMLPPS